MTYRVVSTVAGDDVPLTCSLDWCVQASEAGKPWRTVGLFVDLTLAVRVASFLIAESDNKEIDP